MMEETVIVSDSNDELPKERMTPLGASENEASGFNETLRLKALEEEQEQLNGSLMSLTTHFAQVQFRLRQIVNAPNEMKEELLKELEEFASRGCPDLKKRKILMNNNAFSHEQIIEEQRLKQKQLIEELKLQLKDLESYAYQSGDLDMPSTVIMEKHKVIIDELKQKINLPIENINKLSDDDLKKVVDSAISQIVNPVKVKEQLVGQLKTQIADLERFIDFLQGEANSPGPYAKSHCKCPVHDSFSFPSTSKSNGIDHVDRNNNNSTKSSGSKYSSSRNYSGNLLGAADHKEHHHKTVDMLKKMLTVIQIFAITQLSCGTKTFEKNTLKKTPSANHWGDLRANLEITIGKVLDAGKTCEKNMKNTNLDSDNDDVDIDASAQASIVINKCSKELIHAVRKEFAIALRDLLQHGLMEVNYTTSLVPAFACFPLRARENEKQLHAWDLFTKYYEIKHGKEFTDSPARKLSQSFNLDVIGGRAITIKQSLLSTIETVVNLHKQYKNNKDSQLKTFICIALNEKKLVLYLKQLLKTAVIIENYYQSWSYVKSTGFDDALKSLDQLKTINFHLPIERTMKTINNKINDLF